MCSKLEGFKLCTCDAAPVIHNRKSRRNRKVGAVELAVEYALDLRRYIETVPSSMVGRTMMPSCDLGEGLTEDFVVEKLNTSNCFDFDYVPQERDSLRIHIKGSRSRYMAFGYENGQWTIGLNYEAFDNVLEDIGEGQLKKLYAEDPGSFNSADN